MADLSPLLRPGMRVLEIGCAEGSLGARIRQSVALSYTGTELSADAETARTVLDRVVGSPQEMGREEFDLVLCFHVLEHIDSISEQTRLWHGLLAPGGRLVVETPSGSGHPLLDRDPNPEHLHQFTAASIAALLLRTGFEVESIASGHWESSVYSNSLRVIATPALAAGERRELLLRRFRQWLPKPFAVWGTGGDFRAYVEPLLDSLPVATLLDIAAARLGERHGNLTVEAYDPQRHRELDILVCSVRYRDDIMRHLAGIGIEASRLVCLDDIFGPQE